MHVAEILLLFAIGNIPQDDLATAAGLAAAGRQPLAIRAETEGVDSIHQRRVGTSRADGAFQFPGGLQVPNRQPLRGTADKGLGSSKGNIEAAGSGVRGAAVPVHTQSFKSCTGFRAPGMNLPIVA